LKMSWEWRDFLGDLGDFWSIGSVRGILRILELRWAKMETMLWADQTSE